MTKPAPGRQNRLKTILINLGLVSASLIVSYAVLGAFLLAYGPALAWKPFNKFPTAATIPWQPSGPGSRDEPYIAILGDSYAAGLGDWNANRRSRTEPYYSGDVISQALGMPVLSFGKNGAGSVRALVTNPGHIMNAGSCFLLTSPAPPKSLVVYVYEGNDFDNNIRNLDVPADGVMKPGAVAGHIEAQAASVEDVPCYEYVKHIVVNLITGYVKFFRSTEYTPDSSNGQPVIIAGKTNHIPNALQGPALQVEGSRLETSFEILSQSLDHLMQRFRGTPVLLVHVPSVLTPYRFVADTVRFSLYHEGEPVQPASNVYRASDSLCSGTRRLALAKGLRFLDARPALSALAAKQEIHGPLDWKHLNRAGQTALGMAVAASLKQGTPDSGCTKLAETG